METIFAPKHRKNDSPERRAKREGGGIGRRIIVDTGWPIQFGWQEA
ncbi:hypothetical protein [Allomuricauda sp. M10]|nr:hypothetical protein [Muricauda sp. M10]